MATENVQTPATTENAQVSAESVQNTNQESTEAKVTSAFQIPDDAQVEVVVRGEKVLKPWKEARAGIQMQEDYTRGKQTLAQKMKEVDEMFQGLTGRQAKIAEKEAALDAILGRSTPNKPKQDELSDDDVPTVGQLKRMFQEHSESLKKDVNTTVADHVGKTEEQRRWERFEERTTLTVEALVKENPLLEDIPNLDIILKREAAKDKPTTEQEMVASMLKAGKNLVAKLDSRFNERQKEIVTRKKKLAESGPVPKGGAPQFAPATKTYGKGRKIDWDAIEKDASEALDTLED